MQKSSAQLFTQKGNLTMRRGRELTEKEAKNLLIGSHVWIYWAKDDNPEYERYNGVFMVEEQNADHFVADAEEWPHDGDTSRGQARYYDVRRG